LGAYTLPPGGYYLAANSGYDEAGVPRDVAFTSGLTAAGAGIAIRDSNQVIIDSVGYGLVNNIFIEGTRVSAPGSHQSQLRGDAGCTDTDNNANDFNILNPSSPRNSSSMACLCVPLDTPPMIDNTIPFDGAEDISPDVMIGLEFSEAVTIGPGGFHSIICGSSTQAATIAGIGASYTLDPIYNLPYTADCEVTIYAGAVFDLDGIQPDPMAADHVFSFKTESDPAPTVTGVMPSDDATGVDPDANLTVSFSEPVDVADGWYTIACATSGQHAAVVTGGPSSYTLDSVDDFLRGENCTVTLESTLISDQDTDDPWDEMMTDFFWSFTTLLPDPAPLVISNLPLDDAINVALDTSISVTFSEAVNLDPGWFTISCAGSGMHAGIYEGDITQTCFQILPESDFQLDETCTVTIRDEAVHDLDVDDPPDAMGSDHVWIFNTAEPSFYIFLSLILSPH
ncbi:MAG: Ig-like domain-containing protein, partial [Anaerolineaceae bacterium]|nr:Ig-like domain-containing protein [Anaerolineaceae bacterium]